MKIIRGIWISEVYIIFNKVAWGETSISCLCHAANLTGTEEPFGFQGQHPTHWATIAGAPALFYIAVYWITVSDSQLIMSFLCLFLAMHIGKWEKRLQIESNYVEFCFGCF